MYRPPQCPDKVHSHLEMMDAMIECTGEFTERFPRKPMGRSLQLDETLPYLMSSLSDFATVAVIKVADCRHPR